MTTNEPDIDPRLCDALAEAHEAMIVEETFSGTSSSISLPDTELASRFESAQDCLRALERCRRSRSESGHKMTAVDLASKSLGHFQIAGVVGEGSYGIVYRATDLQLDRQVALKIPRPEVTMSPTLRERFRHEAGMAARLEHENIVQVYEAGEIDGIHFIATAFCDGPDLQQWLDQHETLFPERDAAKLVITLAEAMAHAHSRGVLHRDLKPSNVLLSDSESNLPKQDTAAVFGKQIPKITDFGLARIEGDVGGMTIAGSILGTPAYMAPEQAIGDSKQVGTTADIYALGAILYRLLTGRVPFEEPSLLETLEAVRLREPPPPQQLRADLPKDLNSICMKCLEKDPRCRYSTTLDLADDLRCYLDGKPVTARPLALVIRYGRWGKRNPLTAALCIGLAILLSAIALGSSIAATHIARQRDAATENLNRALVAENELQETIRQLKQELHESSYEPDIQAFTRVIDNDPKAFETLYQRGTKLWRIGDYHGAAVDFKRVLKIVPDHPFAQADLAWIYLIGPPEMRNVSESLELTKRAMINGQENWSIEASRALSLFRGGRYAKARVFADRTIRLRAVQGDQANTLHYCVLAMVQFKLGEVDEAQASYETALQRIDATRWELPGSEIDQIRQEARALLSGNE